ncbi:rhodanese-related sulfurtransferase [Dehalococcoides mccartyi]|nr:rhodanese-related sulfurtransferase [Dehalococcoides mccartyi]
MTNPTTDPVQRDQSPSASEQTYTVAALYHFAKVEDPAGKKAPLLELCHEQGIFGTLILAEEGINGTISGLAPAVQTVLDHLQSWPGIHDIEVKYSYSENLNFNRMKVKIKEEIVTMGVPHIDPVANAGTYVDPADWNELISREDVLVIDTRNSFEFGVGRFAGAIDPVTKEFNEFPEWADHLASGPAKPKAVAMYCTGGIRCEKATVYMKDIGFDEVYHLKGGILKYLEEVPEEESLWEDECFVFDHRVSLKHGLVEGEYMLCYGCQNPISPADRESPMFELGVSCPHCDDSLSNEDRDRFRERQLQIRLSRERGESHLKDNAAKKPYNKRGGRNTAKASSKSS